MEVKDHLAALERANRDYRRDYPGDVLRRQPVHTVYGGAHLFKAETINKLGQLAHGSLSEYAPDAATFAAAIGLSLAPDLEAEIYRRVADKLKREAIEDYRIDFEDGYGYRADAEEDAHAVQAANELARAVNEKILPESVNIGIRVKALSEECKERSARTLVLFFDTYLQKAKLPMGFVVTLPKVLLPEQVSCFVALLKIIEKKHSLAEGSIKIEIMVEATQSLVDGRGLCQLPALIKAGEGRCQAAHFGAYDYTATCDITATYQKLNSGTCDFARHMMKVALAGRGVWLSDGATNVMPVGPHRAAKGETLNAAQKAENQSVVHRAWKLSYDDIRHSLSQGFYQGWDLHPAQIPVRYAACYAFFLEGLPAATARLKSFMEKAAQANLVGDTFDDAASGQGLLNYFLRAINCGAIESDSLKAVGLTAEEIAAKSFQKILTGRRRDLKTDPQDWL